MIDVQGLTYCEREVITGEVTVAALKQELISRACDISESLGDEDIKTFDTYIYNMYVAILAYVDAKADLTRAKDMEDNNNAKK